MDYKIRISVKKNERLVYKFLRSIYQFIQSMSFPAPRIIYKPLYILYRFLYYFFTFLYKQVIVIPFFKTIMKDYGKNLKAGVFLPFVVGAGEIRVGNDVKLYGKIDFIFGTICEQIPRLYIGDKTTIGHNVTFDVSSTVKIGNDCLVAKNVTFQDCNGHHIDPYKRRKKFDLTEFDVKPIYVGDNVWIGTNAYILPGTTIESGCVIGAGVVVKGHIPENSLVHTSPAAVKAIYSRSIKIVSS